jgi:hypothetical protein
MNKDLTKILQYFKNLFSPIILTIFLVLSIIIHIILPNTDLLFTSIRLFIGIFAFLYIPGYCITRSFFNKEVSLDRNIFYLVIGITYQLLVLFIGWWYYRFVGCINFAVWIYTSSVIVTLITTAISKDAREFPFRTSNINLRENVWLLIVLSAFLIISLYYQQYAPSPHTDGAAYMDLARNLVKHGVYCSNMVYPKGSYESMQFSSGLIEYFYNYLLIAIFFMLGNISFFTAKIMLIFVHLLNILLIFNIATKLFNKRVAILASLLSATSPIVLAHVGLAGGAEIPGTLFMLAAIYTLLSCIPIGSSYQSRKGILAGILIGIAYYTWTNTGFVLLLALVAYFIYNITFVNVADKKVALTLFLLVFSSLILEIRFLMVLVRMIIGIQLPTLFPILILISLFLARKRKKYEVLVPYLLALLTFFVIIYLINLAELSTSQAYEFLQASVSEPSSPLASAIKITGLAYYLTLLTKVDAMYRSWYNYWEVLMSYVGCLVIYLSFFSFIRLNKLRENVLIMTFPLLHALLWTLIVQYPSIQPRQQINVSVFYFILVANFIDFILSFKNRYEKNILFSIILSKKLKMNFDLSLFSSFLLIITIIFINVYPSYHKGIDLMRSWDYRSMFGWDQAIDWIKTNIKENDVIISRSANYFAWYTERKIAWLPINNSINLDDLVNAIRMYKAKYLLIDERTYYLYPNLRGLYLNPRDFLGAHIVFHSELNGHRVIIYNVTNIAFGELVIEEYVLDNGENTSNWYVFSFYGNATLELDPNEKVQDSYSIKYVQTLRYNALAIRFQPITSINLSDYDFLDLKMKAYEGSYVVFLFGTDSSNYFVSNKIPISIGNWVDVKISLKSLNIGNGNPSLTRVNYITIYLGDIEVGKTCTVWFDGLVAYRMRYVLKEG